MNSGPSNQQPLEVEPWYRQFWPWFLIALPGSVVIAGIVTIYIAMENPQPLVKSDYYKEGLAINRDLADEQKALDSGITASINLQAESQLIYIELSAKDSVLLPPQLELSLIHPTDDKLDNKFLLNREANSLRYATTLERDVIKQLSSQRWYIQLKPSFISSIGESWLLRGELFAEMPLTRLGAAVD